MVSKSKSAAGSAARSRRRSAFREEFYADRRPDVRVDVDKRTVAKARLRRRRKRKASLVIPIFSLFFLLCLIAIAGSSAVIWLRKLGSLFGVEWSGDS